MKKAINKKKVINDLIDKKIDQMNKIKGGNQIGCTPKKQICMVVTCTCPPCCGSTPHDNQSKNKFFII